MVEVLGRGYVIEHCISALNYDRARENERKSFEIYVTDALMAIADNTSHVATINGIEQAGMTIKARWYDILDPPTEPQEIDDRPCEDIAKDIFARIRGDKT